METPNNIQNVQYNAPTRDKLNLSILLALIFLKDIMYYELKLIILI